MERPAVRSETQRFVLSVEYIQVVGISEFVKNMPEISAPRPPMDFMFFFLDEKHIPSGFGNEANRGAAKLDSEAGRGAGADRFISGVKGDISAEGSDFRCVFFNTI